MSTNRLSNIERLNRLYDNLIVYNNNIQNYHTVTSQYIEHLNNTIVNYNRNMTLYNNNLNTMINNIISLERTINANSRQTNTDSEFLNYINSLPTISGSGTRRRAERYIPSFELPITTFSSIYNISNRQSTRNLLTREQINNATEQIPYTDSMNEYRCPVSLAEFTVGETITRIKHCGHIFKTQSLNTVLLSSCLCPVCRYDLRTYENTEVNTNNNTNNTNSENHNDMEDDDSEDVEDIVISETDQTTLLNAVDTVLNTLVNHRSNDI